MRLGREMEQGTLRGVPDGRVYRGRGKNERVKAGNEDEEGSGREGSGGAHQHRFAVHWLGGAVVPWAPLRGCPRLLTFAASRRGGGRGAVGLDEGEAAWLCGWPL